MNCIVCKNIKSLSILPLTCLLVSAFWISSATAQVNGSGTSDSALFDTVITLTSDNSFLSGSIGGVDNETTQLNVPADTLVDFEFEANSGSEVNVNGGTLDLLFSVDQGEVNISGDSFVDSNFSATNSEVNISGGIVGPAFASTNSVVNFSGGTLNVEAQATNSIFNISGGTVGVPLGTGLPFLVAVGSEVNILGSDFSIDGVPLIFNGSSVITDRDVTLSGVLDDGSSFSYTLGSQLDGSADLLLDADSTLTLVPEPSSLMLVTLFAGMGLATRRRR